VVLLNRRAVKRKGCGELRCQGPRALTSTQTATPHHCRMAWYALRRKAGLTAMRHPSPEDEGFHLHGPQTPCFLAAEAGNPDPRAWQVSTHCGKASGPTGGKVCNAADICSEFHRWVVSTTSIPFKTGFMD